MRLIERFESRIVKTDGCWFWQGSTNTQGYGMFAFLASNPLAHRFAYELYVDQIPTNFELHHICENPVCVRPDHLEPVTRKQNMAKAASRQPMRARRYDLASSEVRVRRVLLNLSRNELALKAGVSVETVVNVEIGRHIPHDSTLLKLANALGCDIQDLLESKQEAVS